MAEKSLNVRSQQKIDTTANWAKATNFIPKKGEIIVYSDGGGTGIPKIKVGDGTTVVGNLKFLVDGNITWDASQNATFPASLYITNNLTLKGNFLIQKDSYPQMLFQNKDQSKTLSLLYSNTTTGDYADAILRVYSSASEFNNYKFAMDGTLTAKKFNGPATSALELSSTDPKLAYANDGNTVQLLSNTQVLLPTVSSQSRITKALDFQHYDTHWRIGNLRGGSTNSLGFAFSYSADNETYTLPAYIDTDGGYHGKLANSLTLNTHSYNASSAISLTSQQLGVPSAFIAKSVSVLDCNSEKIGRVLSSSSSNSLVNGPSEIGSTGAGVLWNIPALSAPTSSVNASGTWQYLHQVFITGTSGRVFIRSSASNGTAGNWSYGEWAKVLTDKNFTSAIAGKLNIDGENLLNETQMFSTKCGGVGVLQSIPYYPNTTQAFVVRRGTNTSDNDALIVKTWPTLEANKSYTLSFWAKGSGSIQGLITGYSYPCTSISSEGTTSTDDGGANTIPLTSSWKRYWITFTMGNWSSAASGKALWLRARTNDSGNVADVCGLKWENGTIATGWTSSTQDKAAGSISTGTNLIPECENWYYTVTSTTSEAPYISYTLSSLSKYSLENKEIVISYTIDNEGDGEDFSSTTSGYSGYFGAAFQTTWKDSTGTKTGTYAKNYNTENITEKGGLRRVQYVVKLLPPTGYDTLTSAGFTMWLKCRPTDSSKTWIFAYPKVELAAKTTSHNIVPETSSRLVLLSTAWTGSGPYSATLACSHITADNTVIVSMAAPVSQVQYETFCKAQITAASQADGSITFTAYGTKPTINLPIAITTLGG